MQKISQLTPQQEARLLEYKRKWQLAALCTKSIDKQKATKAIEAIHQQLTNVEEVDIYFFDSPLGIADLSFLPLLYPGENWCNPKKLNNLLRRVENQLISKLIGHAFWQHIVLPQIGIVGDQVDMQLWHYIEKELHFWSPFSNLISINLKDKEKLSPIWQSAKSNQQQRLEALWFLLASGLVIPDEKYSVCCLLDYCITELQCIPEENLWQILKTFIAECGRTFFFKDFCFACDRPCRIIFDKRNQTQSESEAIIEFSDNFRIFGTL